MLIGVDEAGRGPLAGPVVVAAVGLGPGGLGALAEVRDSKILSAERRESLFPLIRARAAAISLAWAFPRRIETDNILAATLSAMGRAAARLPGDALVLVDGDKAIPGLARPQMAIVGGDDLSLAIACASVVAKVVRDRWMRRLDRRYPGYGLARHKGYCTPEHVKALEALGPSPAHRATFEPVRALLAARRAP
ncbi:MAG: ribonuclease HII [Elusimicrobia bacterium]|nr:ribonuclease HII [Elusimicrobiota bacterium]